jgi:hypothetical protein
LKHATLRRRSTVESLPLQLVFPGGTHDVSSFAEIFNFFSGGDDASFNKLSTKSTLPDSKCLLSLSAFFLNVSESDVVVVVAVVVVVVAAHPMS